VNRKSLYTIVLSFLLVSACATGRYIAPKSGDYQFTLDRPRDMVFDALLGVAQTLNLSVDVLEKQSGYIQFKNASLSPVQLDRYCTYPYVNPGTGQAWDTFINWNQRSLAAGAGALRGSVSLSILLSEPSPGTTVAKMHSTWISSNNIERTECSFLLVFEKNLESTLRVQLARPQG
jgi:hypothetical protein